MTVSLNAAGRKVPDGVDRIRRYCGLPWSGGSPETWAWQYYDSVPTPADDSISPVDVLCAAAVHPGLSREDLAWFRSHSDEITSWLRGVPSDRRFWELEEAEMTHLASLPEALPGPNLSLLSKVLHRKRPDVIPLVDRHVIDWYRPVTGQRAAAAAWDPLIQAIWDEERDEEHRLVTAMALVDVARELRELREWEADDARSPLTWIRAKDIAIWMGSL